MYLRASRNDDVCGILRVGNVFKRTVITHNTGLKIMLYVDVIHPHPPTKSAYARFSTFSAPELNEKSHLAGKNIKYVQEIRPIAV